MTYSKKHFVLVVAYLYVLLFVYAAVSKLLDFETFTLQLAQSPLLSAYAGVIAWLVPGVEILISIFLMIPRYRSVALYASFFLMVMFTTYIIIILNFSDFIPCSCGGVLEKLSWGEHLIFNIFFLLLAIFGIILSRGEKERARNPYKKKALLLSASLALGIGFVSLLFVCSEDITHNRNTFIRRFPHHPVTIEYQLDLKLNSYYIAGMDKKNVYLSNVTAPLHIKVLNSELETIEENEIFLPNLDLPFRSPTVKVDFPNFYFVDGYVPVIFNGKISSWNASLENEAKAFFSLITPLDSVTFAIRTRDSRTNENILGILKIGDSSSIKLSRDILVKQIDGVFDTDGMLLYNQQLGKIIYTYFYRNQFIVMDTSLKIDFRGKTIDTVSKAQIKVSYVASETANKLSAPPLVVNKSTATYGNYLFIHSGLMGRFEPKDTWNKSSVIDVYDLTKNIYAFSFYIQNRGKDRMTEFYVYGDRLVCLIGDDILTYKLNGDLFSLSK